MSKTIRNLDEYTEAGRSYMFDGSSIMANGATLDLVFTTPDSTDYTHLNMYIGGSVTLLYTSYEGITYTGGVTITPINKQRNSAKTSALSIFASPSPITVSAGTQLMERRIGSTGNYPTPNTKLILKADDHTVFRIVSEGDDNIVTYIAEWFEDEVRV